MAEAGWPLRRETFYYSHRKGGAQLLPFDIEAELTDAGDIMNMEDALMGIVADIQALLAGPTGRDRNRFVSSRDNRSACHKWGIVVERKLGRLR